MKEALGRIRDEINDLLDEGESDAEESDDDDDTEEQLLSRVQGTPLKSPPV